MEQDQRVSSRARVWASGATALVYASVLTVIVMISDMARSDADVPRFDAMGYLILFIPNLIVAWITVLLILGVYRFFLGFFDRAMPPLPSSLSHFGEREKTQPRVRSVFSEPAPGASSEKQST